jgi:site-specific recombinase XerD
MSRNHLNLNFNLRNPSSLTETPINLILRYNHQKLIYPTAEAILVRHWQNDKTKKGYQKAKQNGSFPEFPEFNARLGNIEKTVRDCFRRYQNDHDNQVPDKEQLKKLLDEEFNRNPPVPKGFLGYIEGYIVQSANRSNPGNGRLISHLTIKKYRSVLNHLKQYCKNSGKALNFDDIDLTFYENYTKFLMTDYNLAANSIGKDIACIKVFLNDATEKGFNKTLTYKNKRFLVVKENSDNIYLTEAELHLLFTLDLSAQKSYDRVRDLFLLGCFTGLRYSDFSVLNKSHLKNGKIVIETYKTGETVIIPLHPVAKAIFLKYHYDLPASISNQKTNDYLKEIAKLIPQLKCPVTKKITKGGARLSTIYQKWELVTTHTALCSNGPE